MHMESAVLTSCRHLETLCNAQGLQRLSRAAESVFAPANRPLVGIGSEGVPRCLHPECRYPMSCDVHVCVCCVHMACSRNCLGRAGERPGAAETVQARVSHLTSHFQSSGHALYLSVEHGHLFCVPCNDFVYSRFLDGALEIESKIAQAHSRNFTSSLSPLDPPLQRGMAFGPFLARERNKKRRLSTHGGWTPSDKELDEISKQSVPLRSPKGGIRPPVGLFNLGNSCYMNSVLQAFMNAPPLRHFFLAGQHKPECTRDLKLECFACAMDQLVCDSCFSAENGKKNSSPSSLEVPFLVPHTVLDIVWRNAEHLATYTQHDAHEFLIAALNLLNAHCRVESSSAPKTEQKLEPIPTEPGVKREPILLGKGQGDSRRKMSPISPVTNLRADPGGAFSGADLLSNRSTSSIVQNLFSGTLQSDVVCRKCNNSSPTLEKFYDISLDVDKLTKPASTRRSRAQSPAVDYGNDETNAAMLSGAKAAQTATATDDRPRGKMKDEDRAESNDVMHTTSNGVKTSADGVIGNWESDRDKDLDTANTLHECLSRFTEPELLGASSKMDCLKCGTRQEATKQMSIRTLPPILCFHFKRFEQSFASIRRSEMVKIDTPVEFPADGLDLSAFLTSEVLRRRNRAKTSSATTTVETALVAAMRKRLKTGDDVDPKMNEQLLRDNQESMYDLFAVVNHIGKIDSGHYTAMIRRLGHWFRCDDEKVSPIDNVDQVIRSEEAYLVFYAQRHPNFHY